MREGLTGGGGGAVNTDQKMGMADRVMGGRGLAVGDWGWGGVWLVEHNNRGRGGARVIHL